MAGNDFILLEWLGIAGNCWKWMELQEIDGMAGNGWKWQELARNSWKVLVWLEMAGNG